VYSAVEWRLPAFDFCSLVSRHWISGFLFSAFVIPAFEAFVSFVRFVVVLSAFCFQLSAFLLLA
jgi:hypothetical protein